MLKDYRSVVKFLNEYEYELPNDHFHMDMQTLKEDMWFKMEKKKMKKEVSQDEMDELVEKLADCSDQQIHKIYKNLYLA